MANPALLITVERQRNALHSAVMQANGELQAPTVLAASRELDRLVVLVQLTLTDSVGRKSVVSSPRT